MTVEIFVVVVAGAGDRHDLPRAEVTQNLAHGRRDAAVAEDEHLFPPNVDPAFGEHNGKPVKIGVVAEVRSVVAPDDGVDAAAPTSRVRQLRHVRNDRLFIGDGHVEAVVFAASEEVGKLLRLALDQLVVAAAQHIVNHR